MGGGNLRHTHIIKMQLVGHIKLKIVTGHN